MKKQVKQQAFVIFVLLMFVGSGLAYAVMWVFPEQPKTQLMYNMPLSNSEEAQFLQKNLVVVKLFYLEENEDSKQAIKDIQDIFQELNGKMIIEFIDIDMWKDDVEAFDVKEVPFFYLKGKTIDKTGKVEREELIKRICNLYFEPIDECALIS